MEIQEPTNSFSRETCLGIPLVEERQFSDEERTALEKQSKRGFLRNIFWRSIIPLICLVFILIGTGFIKNDVSYLIGAIWLILSLLITATLLWRSEKVRKTAQLDIEDGKIKCFYGFGPGRERERDLASLREQNQNEPKIKIGGIDVFLWHPIKLEVFSKSRRLWRVNGVAVKNLYFMQEEQTSLQPERAKVVANWTPSAQVIAGRMDFSESGRRDLTEIECAEIFRAAKSFFLKAGPLISVLNASAVVFVFLQWQSGLPFHVKPIAFFYLAFYIWIDSMFVIRSRLSYRLYKDAKLGMVVVTRFPDVMNGDEIFKRGRVMEWLPFSRYKWTVDGEPAPWRLRG